MATSVYSSGRVSRNVKMERRLVIFLVAKEIPLKNLTGYKCELYIPKDLKIIADFFIKENSYLYMFDFSCRSASIMGET